MCHVSNILETSSFLILFARYRSMMFQYLRKDILQFFWLSNLYYIMLICCNYKYNYNNKLYLIYCYIIILLFNYNYNICIIHYWKLLLYTLLSYVANYLWKIFANVLPFVLRELSRCQCSFFDPLCMYTAKERQRACFTPIQCMNQRLKYIVLFELVLFDLV